MEAAEQKKRALEFLHAHDICTLSTVSDDNTPESAAMYYAVDNDLNFYFLTKDNTSKYKNIENNKKASVVVMDSKTDQCIQMEGTGTVLPGASKTDPGVEKLFEVLADHSRYWSPPVIQLHGGETIVIKIKPEKMRFSDFALLSRGNADEGFIEMVL